MAANHSAALSVIADHLDRYHEQVGDLVPGFHTGSAGHEADAQPSDPAADVVIALVEAERALRTAARLVRRAARLADLAR